MENDYQLSYQIAQELMKRAGKEGLRNLEFEEVFLPEEINFQQTGLYTIQIAERKEKVEQPTAYCFDPLVLNQLMSQPQKSSNCGLINMGSSCYMNSAIQALIVSSALYTLFQAPYYQQLMSGNQVANALFKTLKQFKKQSFVPRDMANVLPVFGMSPYQQSDASELIMKMLDVLIEHEVKTNHFEKESFLNKETTSLDQLIGQRHVQTLRCPQCKAEKHTVIHSRTLLSPLEKTLKRSFRKLVEPIEIQDYRCEFCNQRVTIQKQLEILDVSRVFMVQIQRWDDFGRKSQRRVSVPEFLNLSDGLTFQSVQRLPEVGSQRDPLTQMQGRQGATHRLISVVCHSGAENFGHYYSYVFRDSWREANDEEVNKVSLETVTEGAEALFLIYEKIEQAVSSFKMVQQVNTYQEKEEAEQPCEEKKQLPKEKPTPAPSAAPKPHKIPQSAESTPKPVQRPISAKPATSGKNELIKNPFQAPKVERLKAATSSEILREMQPGGILSAKSDILHAPRSEMDMEIDAPRRRKTQEMRDQNRMMRQQEIDSRRREKTQEWHRRQQRIQEDKDRIRNKLHRK